jgi:N-dimethylarginine dimethylaminohydrolase
MAGAERAAAYHGAGWSARTESHRAEIERGLAWSALGTDSEWAPLRRVLLTLPDPEWPAPGDWNAAQLLGPVDFGALHAEMAGYAEVLGALGIEVDLATAGGGEGEPPYNAIFARDQFLATYEGAVVSRMASTRRRGEEQMISVRLTAAGHPVLRTIRGEGCFEAADALWVTPGRLLIGAGRRTNAEGARQVAAAAAEFGVAATVVGVPPVVQHLLGIVQIVGPDLALVRAEHDPDGDIRRALSADGVKVVAVPEHPEVTSGQAMNVVVCAEREVIALSGRPHMTGLMAAAGIAIRATVDAETLVRCAGGLACATGIVRRDPAGERP